MGILASKAPRIVQIIPLAISACLGASPQAFADQQLIGAYNQLVVLYNARRFEDFAERVEPFLQQEKAEAGETDARYLEMLSSAGEVNFALGRFSTAEDYYTRQLSLVQKYTGLDSPISARAINAIGMLKKQQGQYAQAEAMYKNALALTQSNPAYVADTATEINNLGVLYQHLGRFAEAEPLLKQALVLREQATGQFDHFVANSLENLASFYKDLGRYQEAEGVFKRAVAIYERILGPINYHILGAAYAGLGILYQRMGNFAQAERCLTKGLALGERADGPDAQLTAQTRKYLAGLYLEMGRYREAERHFTRAMSTLEPTFGSESLVVASALDGLGTIYAKTGRLDDAAPIYERALAIRRRFVSNGHPDLAQSLVHLAQLKQKVGQTDDALKNAREAASVATRALSVLINDQPPDIAELRLAFDTDLDLLRSRNATAEAFEIAQWADQSVAAAALQQMAARFSAGNGGLAELVRRQQDAAQALRASEKQLVAEFAKPAGERYRGEERAQKQVEKDQARLIEMTAALRSKFPDYAELTRPQPVSAVEAQKLLSADEAMVFLLAGADKIHVFALSHDTIDWKTIDVGGAALAAKVLAFRQGLDLDEIKRLEKPQLFDLGRAHELYKTLLQPVEVTLHTKKHLIVVPTGPLTALPFHLLLTEPPVAANNDVADYGKAPWLIRQYAVSVLPSVPSLKALRLIAHHADASNKPLIGFADPIFNPRNDGNGAATRSARIALRALSDYWQGASVDRGVLAENLPRLVDTADELAKVAVSLDAPKSDLHMRADASETTVKNADLGQYKIVYFATHGLVAGDVKGLAEPSLVMSLPLRPTPRDDGLLTASEVAELKLNADWVVLSACNTIAGNTPNAEAMSGLARSFFYAGARALLVSHWKVASDSSVRLTTGTFDELRKNPGIGRAEALRRSMLAYLTDADHPENAYPALWGPFVIVGEGGP